MDLKVIGSIPITYPMQKFKVKFKKESFYYEAHVWNYTTDIISSIEASYIDKYSNVLGHSYSKELTNLMSIHRYATYIDAEESSAWNWYYLYYINYIFNNNLINANNSSNFEKYNIISINLRSKQFRLSIITSKNTIYNLSIGRALSTLNLLDKFTKKSNKGERLFVEYLTNFLLEKTEKLGLNKIAILNILGFKKGYDISESIIKLLSKNFLISNIVNIFKLPNNYSKLKRIKSIKRRLKKRIVKGENYLN